MDRARYREFLRILELTPDASLAEIQNSYRHLIKFYSSDLDDSIIGAPLEGELTPERRKEILTEIESAYAGLIEMLEKESRQLAEQLKSDESEASLPGDVTQMRGFEDHVSREIGAVFRARGLKKSFNRRLVVKGIDIEVRAGEIIALLGRNGAGKTTSFLMMAGLLRPDSGTIEMDGIDLSGLPASRRAEYGITYLPQENSIFLKTSAENNLKMILEIKQKGRKRRAEIIRGLLADLGLTSHARQPAHTLSGGERRRLEICRALILNPKFLFLDEPFTGIDPITIIELQRIILRLRNRGIGIVLSDHNVRDTLKITDRAYVIDEGVLLAEGTPRTIAGHPAAREKFLGRNFKLGEEVAAYSS
jgi:lipopolysaccharide export system ATP-binding protein